MTYVPKLPKYIPEKFTITGGFSQGVKVDMRDLVPKVLDQGSEGSCVGNAIAADMNLLSNSVKSISRWSALGIYQDTLKFENRVGQQGLYPHDAFYVLTTTGIGSEETQPYNLDNLNTPQTQAHIDSKKLVSGLHELFLDDDNLLVPLNDARSALAEGRPILVSFTARQWLVNMGQFDDIKTQQLFVSRQNLFDQTVIGGHEVLIVGYDPTIDGGSFIFQNSWGTRWGDDGFGAAPAVWLRDWTSAVVLDGFENKDFTYSADELAVIQLYTASLGRPADMGVKSQALFKNKVALSAYNAVMLRNDNLGSANSALGVITDNPNSVEDAKEIITDNLGITL